MSLAIVPEPPGLHDDDEQQEEADLRDKYEFEIDDMVNKFNDEPPVQHNVYPDSDDDTRSSKKQRGEGDDDFRPGSGNLYKGQTFFTCAAFKETVLNHALKGGRNLKQVRWDTNKCAFDCIGGNCNWRVYCSVKKKTLMWEVKIYNGKHTCVPNGECAMLKIQVIARLFIDKIRYDPEYYLPMKIEEMIRDTWKLTVSRDQCQHARNKALRWIEKEYDEEFMRLRDYRAELLLSNPNSTVDIETIRSDGRDVFDRMYICFDVLRRTWKQSCRPIIGVDGCHLRGKMKGCFLVALGRDADNAIYPIAWAVVQVENIPNWVWFVKKIKEDLGLAEGDGYVMVSDRQKGLIKAVEEELPNIEHRMCVRHIYANLKARHGRLPELKPMVWTLAWSYNEADYRENLQKIMRFDKAVYDDVMKTNPTSWCRAFFKLGSFCEDVENNSTESFNATIVKAREKPMVPMLDLVARLAMVRIFKRSVTAYKHEARITPYAQLFLAREHQAAGDCRVYRSTNNMFQVVLGYNSFRVCLESRSCSCRKWDITGIPCEHGYAVILHRKLEVEDFVINWFSTERWRRTYNDGVIPTQGSKFWPTGGAPVHKPPEPPQTGRKKQSKKNKERRKGVNESPTKKKPKRSVHCGICGKEGHNKKGHKRFLAKNGASQDENEGASQDENEGASQDESQEASEAESQGATQGHVTEQMQPSQEAVSQQMLPSQMHPSQESEGASQPPGFLDTLFSFTRVV